MVTDIERLPNDVKELKNIIIDLNNTFLNEKNNYEKKIDILLEEIKLWKNRLFGAKSEKYYNDEYNQSLLFNEAELGFDENKKSARKEEKLEIKAHQRVKRGRKKLPESLPREVRIIDIPESEKVCASGKQRKLINWEISEKLDIKPPEVKVIQTKRAVYGCPDSTCVICEEQEKPSVIKATMPLQLLDKSILTAGLFSFIITSKYCDHLPYYRLDNIFNRYGIDISRQTLSRWTILIYEKYKVLKELLWEELLSGPLIGIDETTMQVIKEEGRSAKRKSYLWVFRGGDPKAPAILFKYRETRQTTFLLELLKEYRGYIQTDGYENYKELEALKDIILTACWAHARRKFDEAAKASKNKGSAYEALSMIRKLYLIEKQAKEYTEEERQALREREAVPVLKKIKEWLDVKHYQVLPESLIGKAVNYALKLWPRLSNYVNDGCIPIDNNGVENALRPECLGKKNWLFAYTPSGANASAFFYSLVETAKANGLEPYWYLRYLFKHIITAKSKEDLRTLLPQHVAIDKILEYQIHQRYG